jgi:hypothetical protein
MIDQSAFVELINTLVADMTAGIELYTSTDRSPFALRTYVRSFFAYVEAWAYLTKQLVLEEPVLHVVSPNQAEVALLREEAYDVSDSGEAVTRIDRFIPLDRNIRFVFAVAAHCFGSTYKLDVSGRGWQAFREAIRIRNRLMHPKLPTDLALSDSEFQAVKDAQLWFWRVAVELQESAEAALKAHKPAGA